MLILKQANGTLAATLKRWLPFTGEEKKTSKRRLLLLSWLLSKQSRLFIYYISGHFVSSENWQTVYHIHTECIHGFLEYLFQRLFLPSWLLDRARRLLWPHSPRAISARGEYIVVIVFFVVMIEYFICWFWTSGFERELLGGLFHLVFCGVFCQHLGFWACLSVLTE